MPSRQTPPASPTATHYFSGGGEMGRRVRSLDWASTPLGPIEGWPPELRATTRVMLDSRQPMQIWWGPALTFLYNDAYAGMTLGAKHPWALGRSAREVWSEIWSEVSPRVDGVFATGTATWDEEQLLVLERYGYPEETYHTFSFTPIRDERGGVGGLLVPVMEDTQRVIAARRLKTLRELAARTMHAERDAAAACRTAAAVLAENAHDVPFALVYRLEADGTSARLEGAAHLAAGSDAAPQRVDLAGGGDGWPFAAVLESGRPAELTPLPARCGPVVDSVWKSPVTLATVLPMRKPGQEHLAGFLVAGVSSRRPLDDDYRGFFDLVAGHIATVVANARAAEEERRRAESLAQLDRAKTTFFSDVSHEFRTPLTLIRGPVEEMLQEDDGKLDGQQRGRLEMLRRNAVRLQRLVNTLLEFARAEAGRMDATFEPVDLSVLTRELAAAFGSAVDRAGLRLTIDCPDLPEPVYVDREMWEKIVLNLISNAIKFTFEGEIRVATRAAGGRVTLAVSDTGVGVPAEEMPRLFERFHRVQGTRARTQEGSGIGLALAHELAKLLGGTLEAESVVGKGSTFTLSVPLGSAHLPRERVVHAQSSGVAPEAAAAPFVEEAHRWLPDLRRRERIEAMEATLPPTRRTFLPPGERVLVADDNADMRDYIRRLLEPHWRVRTVENGALALEVARTQPIDLIVTDVLMPEMDGFELLDALRADARTATIPVILLSARAGEEASVAGMRAGADDYMVKPFGARELVARVGARLEIARLRREAEMRVRGILEAITDGVQVIDRGWHVTYMNPAARRFIADAGGDPDSMLKRHFWEEIFTEMRGSQAQAQMLRAMAERVPVEVESYYAPWKRWYESRVYPLPDGGLAHYFRDITARREAAERVLESDVRMRLATESAQVYAWDMDLDTQEMKYSENVASMFGYATLPPEFLHAAEALRVIHVEDRERVRKIVERAIAERGALSCEYRVHCAGGGTFWIASSGKVVADSRGLPMHLVGIAQNITERKLAEESRARSERNTQFVNQLDVLLSPLIGADEMVSLAARRVGEYLDVTRCYLCENGAHGFSIARGDWRRDGLAPLAGDHPPEGALLPQYHGALDGGQSVAVGDTVAAPALGSSAHSQGALGMKSFIAVPYVGGAGWEATLVATRDTPHAWRPDEVQLLREVAGRLWPAVKRARAEAALRESEERFRTMADSSQVMIWSTDARGDLDFANRPYLDFFGIPTRDKARSFQWADQLHPQDREAYRDELVAALAARKPFHARARVRRRDGQWRWIESRANPHLDAAGRLLGMIGTSPDITEMFESQESLRQADRRKDEFLAMLAHELRNPLAPIVNATRALRRLAPAEPELDGVRDLIERQTDQLTRLVDDLLDVSRITQGRIVLRKENVELLTVVARAVETSRPLVDARKHQLAIALPTEPVRIEGDATRLSQVLSNLLNNAAKYTDDGGEIRLSAEVEGAQVVLRVKDNGIGIPPEDLPHIFDLFNQASRSLDRAQGGLGIGLTLVRSLIEMHGGSVVAASAGPGQGSEFTLRLPIVAAQPPGVAPRPRKPPAVRMLPVRARVLVVDDNVDSATSMSLLLKLDGHDVKMAHDGREAVAAAKTFKPDVMLLDIGLPGMSGYEVARELRRDPALEKTLLIALTGYGQAEDRRRSKAAGFDHHLTKPVDEEALARVLGSVAGNGATR